MLCAAQANLLAGLAVLHGRASALSKVQEKGFAAHHAKQPDQGLRLLADQLQAVVEDRTARRGITGAEAKT